ncbi:hypothetical protein PAXRUDRAFT_830365 [Paxillus rubicundulus Ve08.2h10]|uniref:Uncharacterized protein n=1 Tax=Paxillus rubicundulus Ve08.2h10 TaxID=930991 RepID=A0A0D0DL88_9AGAM|nr:hypothetical protein PAXRUDRAFT_830365 [Paxillus rubicundulus Ve08.2h10]
MDMPTPRHSSGKVTFSLVSAQEPGPLLPFPESVTIRGQGTITGGYQKAKFPPEAVVPGADCMRSFFYARVLLRTKFCLVSALVPFRQGLSPLLSAGQLFRQRHREAKLAPKEVVRRAGHVRPFFRARVLLLKKHCLVCAHVP